MLNRGNRREAIFRKPADYDAFLDLMTEAARRVPMRLLAYCLMPNHWHLALWPAADDAVSAYVGWLSNAHVRGHHRHYGTAGQGHLYQGRFKAFAVQTAEHLFAVLRYVEANALRAGLVRRAEEWSWSSLRPREQGPRIADWPLARPAHWLERVNQSLLYRELTDLRRAVAKGRPYGDSTWTERTARTCGVAHTLRQRGRPHKRQGEVIDNACAEDLRFT